MEGKNIQACPFCGGRDITQFDDDWAAYHGGEVKYYMHCNVCGSSGPRRNSGPEALDAWNNRPFSPQINTVTAPLWPSLK